MLLRGCQMAVRPFATAEDFLAEVDHLPPGCVLVDIRLPGNDGVSLISDLSRRRISWPTIAMTGHAEVRTAVKAMKLGAIEFLEKPFPDCDLLTALDRGFEKLEREATEWRTAAAMQRRLAELSERQRAVLERLALGKSNKQIGADLGLSPRTVESYRANLMLKLEARNVAELIAFAASAGLRITTPFLNA